MGDCDTCGEPAVGRHEQDGRRYCAAHRIEVRMSPAVELILAEMTPEERAEVEAAFARIASGDFSEATPVTQEDFEALSPEAQRNIAFGRLTEEGRA